MRTSLFDFELPESLIALQPASPRDSARLLVVSSPSPACGGGLGRGLVDSRISDLLQFLKPGDVMVFNDTRVIPARLWGKRGEAKIEILLHKKIDDKETWRCFAKPAKKLKPGDRIDVAEDFHANVQGKLPDGQVVLQFNASGAALRQQLERHGHMPLPPYIDRDDKAEDKQSYQTVYARHDGSVAAPTAGLHFTENLLQAIDAMGVMRAHVTLHVGGGTFLPVKAEDTKDHVMHSEWAQVSKETAQRVNQAKAKGGRIVAVGTTSLRTLESASDDNGNLQPYEGETDIFITPGYRFKSADMLLTNFHLPKSTLFMLVSAFSGLERMRNAYGHAVENNYRFYSYGDACLLYRS